MEIKTIQAKAREIVITETKQIRTLKIPDDLTGLYGDIRVELSRKAPDDENLIDLYTELMAREQELCSPETAYQTGREAANSGREYALMEYLTRVYLEPDNQSFLAERDSLFYKLSDLLGETRGLMSEYNDLYRHCQGIINNYIAQFYHWGYYGEWPDTTKWNVS